MSITPTGLTLVETFFWIVPIAARLIGSLALKQKNTKFDRHYERGLCRVTHKTGKAIGLGLLSLKLLRKSTERTTTQDCSMQKKTVRSKRTFYAIQKHNKQTDVNLMKVRRVKILPAKDKGTVNFQIPLLTIIVTISVQDNSSYLIRTTSRSPISVQHHRTTIDFFFNFNRRGI